MGKGIVKRLAAVLSLIGPGIFAIGYTIGTGSVTSMAKAGADYGLGLLWVLALSCLFSGVLMTAYGRFAAVTGETTLHGIVRFLPGGKGIAAILFLGVVTAQYTCLGGILILTSGAIREAFGLPVGVFPIACAIMATMLAFAMVGRYAFFEKVLSFFVALMALAFLASVFATWPEPDVLARAARPLLPKDGASLLMLAAFVGTTMAAPTFVTRPLLVREKGLSAGDLGKERIDSVVSASLMFVISGSIVLVATGALFARGATVSSVLDMAETLRPLAGRLAVAIFLCGTLAAGLSSVFPILMVAPLLAGDWRSGRMETRSAAFRILCVVASAWALVVPALGKNPVAVTIAAQVSNVFVLPLAVAAILWLLNRRGVMGEHRAGPWLNALLALAFAFSLAVAFVGGKALCATLAAKEGGEADVRLSNGVLDVVVSPRGAELRSVRAEGAEYMWQREPGRPSGMAPVLFPICGSLNGGRYTFEGREYGLPVHGFAKDAHFRADRAADGAGAVLTLESDETTKAAYPFDFALSVAFRLDGRTLSVEATVTNRGDTAMPFAYGGHPGFRVPLGDEGAFEDWFLEFGPDAAPEAFAFDEGGLLAGSKRAFPLEPGGRLPLRHELFNTFGLFLSGTGGEVTLRSDTSPRSVAVRFPDMPDVGFWHAPGEAPFLCIEPWTGMPSVAGVPDDFAVRPDMIRLAPGAAATLRYFVEFR